jgi:hypothetical protein
MSCWLHCRFVRLVLSGSDLLRLAFLLSLAVARASEEPAASLVEEADGRCVVAAVATSGAEVCVFCRRHSFAW